MTTRPAAEIFDAMQEIDRDGFKQLPVLADGKVEGVLTREDVISFLRRMQTSHPRTRPAT